MSTVMMVPQDEHCIQRMLGVETIPDEIYTEYMIRLRMLHRFVSGGGPLGPIGCIDLLRSLEYAPPKLSAGTGPNKFDWRDIPIGTPVQVRHEGQWSPRDVLFKHAGFVDFGTLAVQSPTGRVDEYRKQNVRLVEDDLPDDVNKESFSAVDEIEAEKTPRQKAYEKQDLYQKPEKASSSVGDTVSQASLPVQNAVDSSNPSSDTTQGEDEADGDANDDPDADDKGEPLGIARGVKRPDWSKVEPGAAVIVRLKEDTCEGTFCGCTNQRVRVVINDDETKKERYVRFDQVMLTESL